MSVQVIFTRAEGEPTVIEVSSEIAAEVLARLAITAGNNYGYLLVKQVSGGSLTEKDQAELDFWQKLSEEAWKAVTALHGGE
ncbi:hypothetical protein A3A66_04585 [Microgenomates group bacterium RIFCSPLOWO2_01_FULL_46_13]|nr:MAG: hypothetical protein A2783_05060 [Microgenomates group bacterium RIFCSPHIGHO2_01_FULL_45_11]OGV94245.1 MAG: hypothetical protein A3A66_04585 [Microgenomates group bacterium RIFCSPLOWO2_01_FULL_46_13]